MSGFLIVAFALLALTLFGLTIPLFRSRQSAVTDRETINIAAARTRLAELESDHAAGIIDAQQLSQLREELEMSLAADLDIQQSSDYAISQAPGSVTAAIVASAVSILAVALYWQLGNPAALQVTSTVAADTAHTINTSEKAPLLDELIDKLLARLQKEPDDLEGWVLLAQTYMTMDRFDEAVEVYAALHDRVPDDAGFLLRFADASAMADGGRISDRTFALIKNALQLEPENTTGLWLSGMAYRERGANEAAIRDWQTLLPLLPDEQSETEVRMLIADAQKTLGENPMQSIQVQTPLPDSAVTVDVTVNINPALRKQLNGGETVFIYARAYEGSRMPIVATRLRVSDLPVHLTLDDSMSLTGTMSLSQVPLLTVGAKISRSGSATPASGDLYGEVSPVEPNSTSRIDLHIDQRVP